MNQTLAQGTVNSPEKILKTVMNKLTFVPHVEIAGVIEAETEDLIASTVSDALKLREVLF